MFRYRICDISEVVYWAAHESQGLDPDDDPIAWHEAGGQWFRTYFDEEDRPYIIARERAIDLDPTDLITFSLFKPI